MYDFSDKNIRLDLLKKKAFNLRWAEQADGVIPLTAADTDFLPPEPISAALKKYIDEGYFPYVPKLGMPDVRQSIARSLFLRKSEPIKPELLLPIDSAARGMYIITKAVLQPGDEAIIFDPVDFLFRESVLSAGAEPVLFPAKVVNGRIDLEALESYVTEKTRLIGLCNPHNPLGMVYSKEDLERILDIANRHDLWIMNDEIWSDIIYTDSDFISIMTLPHTEKVLSVFGFSKSFGLAGLRVGCVYCTDPSAFDLMVEASDVLTTAGGVSSLSQVAAKACVDECYPWLDEFRAFLTQNRDYALGRLAEMPGVKCHKPQATFVLFPDISGTGMEAVHLTEYLKENFKVALVPGGEQFFGPGSKGHIRICISTSRSILSEGLDRLELGLRQLKGTN